MVSDLLVEKDEGKFTKIFNRIEKYEGISDSMEIEIANYLDQVGTAHLSDDTKMKIRSMLREITEIESIGDSCYNIALIKKKKNCLRKNEPNITMPCICLTHLLEQWC